jgi:hypothetical protein
MKTIDDAVRLLWSHAENHLNAEELSTLTGATETAALMAENLSQVCDKLGALVVADEGTGRAGYFREADGVSALLWSIARQVDTIGALVTLGNDAKSRCNELRELTSSDATAKGNRARKGDAQ